MLFQELKLRHEADAAAGERYNKYSRTYPVEEAVQQVLSEHTLFSSATTAHSMSAVSLACRIAKELGKQHSARAACAVLEWFRQRYGRDVSHSLYDACISACTINFSPEQALTVFSELEQDGKVASVRLLNMLISACCMAGFVDVAIEVCPCTPFWLEERSSDVVAHLIASFPWKKQCLFAQSCQRRFLPEQASDQI